MNISNDVIKQVDFYKYNCDCKEIYDNCGNKTKDLSCKCILKENPTNYEFNRGTVWGVEITLLLIVLLFLIKEVVKQNKYSKEEMK